MTATRSRLAAAGFLGGFVAGALLWSREQRLRRRDLFSPRPLRRLAALGFLSGRPTSETASVLRDYVRWEPRDDLRRRGRLLLHRVEQKLD